MTRVGRLLLLASMLLILPAQAQPPTEEQQAQIRQAQALLAELHPTTGDVAIPTSDAMLHLGDDYYFVAAEEAKKILVEGWGNHPDSTVGVLGMVFPAGKTFLDDSWGAVVTWEPTGYVSDDDAKSAEYDEMIKELQAGEEDLNRERTAQGYPAQHLVGWAQAPSYDSSKHAVVWAQNIQFAGQQQNTLNYDVRLLGLKGVLSLNMVTVMSKLPETRDAAAKFAAAASFNPGARYADYKPGVDTKAEFGVAGLVAAGVGVAAAKKLGLLAIILAFGKKFFLLVLLAFAGAGTWIKRRFLGGEDAEYQEPDYAESPDQGWEAPQAADNRDSRERPADRG
jgi:uncharacterized membrane-anchored protein